MLIEKNWSKPVDGVISIPDYLDNLVNDVAFQHKLHTISKIYCENEMYARITYVAERFFKKFIKEKVIEELKKIQRYDVTGGHGDWAGMVSREKDNNGDYIAFDELEELLKKIVDDHKL